ncbi:MAG: DUF4422 domain-containing protein [Bacteroidota bacterium]
MIQILVAFHKTFPHSKDPLFLNVHVGKKNSLSQLGFSGDDTGENISLMNSSFCELTGLYWWWRNGELPEVVGLSHYRRYFDFSNAWWRPKRKQRSKKARGYDFDQLAELHRNKILLLLDTHDIILPIATDLKESIKEHYLHSHIEADWHVLMDVVQHLHPSYDVDFFNRTRNMYEFNMFICKKEIFEKYMEWLFPILFETSKRISLQDHPYQKRVIGFMAERLLNLYVFQNDLRIRSVPVLYFTD